MVAFNTTIPQIPGYIYGEESSRPISPIPADQSKATLIKAGGDLIKGGTEIADDYFKQSIKTAEHHGLDQINEDAISRLNEAKANPALMDMQNPMGQGSMPSALKGLPRNLDTLDQARANNKISQTYIDGQKYQLAQNLRSQYPGYTDFIDDTFARSNRETAANRYISSLVGDINSMSANARAQRDKTETLVQDAQRRGFPNANIKANLWRKGDLTDEEFNDYYQEFANKDYQDKQDQRNLVKEAKTAQERADRSFHYATESVQKDGLAFMSTLSSSAKRTDLQLLDDVKTASENPELAQRNLQQLIQHRAQFIAQTRNKLNSPIPGDPNNNSLAYYMGAQKTQEVIKQGEEMFDEIIKAYTSPEGGAIHAAANLTTAAIDDTAYKMVSSNNPDLASFNANVRVGAAFKKLFPGADDKVLNQFLTMGKGQDGKTFANSLGLITTGITQRILTQTPDSHTGEAPTLGGTLKQIQNLPPGKVSNAQRAKASMDLIQMNINSLTDPTTTKEGAQLAVKGIFGKGNEGTLDAFAKESKLSVLDMLTNDKVAHAVHQAGGDSWNTYSQWVKQTFFRTSMNDIETLNQLPKGFQIGWDNTNHKIVDEYTTSSTQSNVGTPGGFGRLAEGSARDQQKDAAHAAVVRLNKEIDSIKGLSKYEDMDVDSYLLRFLAQVDVRGLGEDLRKSIANANQKPVTGKD